MAGTPRINTSAKELESILPEIRNALNDLQTGEFTSYEYKLAEATAKAISTLEQIIDDGTLALDPEQTINAVSVLTKAKKDIFESKRKLLETCIKGEVMIKALEQPKGSNENSALLEYIEKNKLDKDITDEPRQKSIFETIAEHEGE